MHEWSQMGIREWVSDNPRNATIMALITVAVAVGLSVYEISPHESSPYLWYTTDDGQTWFRDSQRMIPPFDKDGKEAVLAHVYVCNGKRFVAWMERYQPEARQRLLEFQQAEDQGRPLKEDSLIGVDRGHEFKRPGDRTWTTDFGRRTAMMIVKCPDSSKGEPTILFP